MSKLMRAHELAHEMPAHWQLCLMSYRAKTSQFYTTSYILTYNIKYISKDTLTTKANPDPKAIQRESAEYAG